ncbi:MAG: Rpn family recombination-promoting nuclease/putative transposase [Prevotella sp.]|nr:Rpn family recombination-promoting nuclease/putative transposase [Prevotella sp.]
MSKYINPFTDVGFKKIFGQEINKDLLIDFLNSLLKGERVINNVTFLDKEQVGEFKDDRSLIYDVYCETDSGEKIIVEMQNKSQPYFKNRSIYYAAQSVARQGERGSEWGFDVKAVYCISFLNFRQAGISEKFRTDIALMDMQSRLPFSDKIRLIYLQLPLFTKEVRECENQFERWIYVLKNMEKLNRYPFEIKDKVFKKLIETCDVASWTREERIKYDRALKRYRDTLAVMEGQKQEGRAEGRAEGIKEGKEQGRKEAQLDIARNFKQSGIPIDVIAQNTGLSIEEINSL